MGFSQQFIIIIKYEKGNTNNLAYMLLRPHTSKIMSLGTLMYIDPLTRDAYKGTFTKDEDFQEAFQQLEWQVHVEDVDGKVKYHLEDGFLYKLDKIYALKCKIFHLINTVHTSKVA
jgi:hypothetical protein